MAFLPPPPSTTTHPVTCNDTKSRAVAMVLASGWQSQVHSELVCASRDPFFKVPSPESHHHHHSATKHSLSLREKCRSFW